MSYRNTLIIVLITAGLAAIFFIGRGMLLSGPEIPAPTASPIITSQPGLDNLIKLEKPVANQLVVSPLEITGQARGNWYFEASFPVRIVDANGAELGVIPIQAQGDPAGGGVNWMTEEFVPFKGVLKFKKPTTETGTLVLQKDNPSGLPEHDAELRVPIRFDLANWSDEGAVLPSESPASGKCKVTGCSGQICSDEDVVTTCEYKEEYACFKTAKCERQEDNKCGWTPTEDLVACLYSAMQPEPEPQ